MGFQERLLRTEQNVQLTYEFQHRINAAVSFPTISPNGSSILIYAHESGVRVLWRGGRKFAAPTSPANGTPKASAASDSVMILDSDDEPSASADPTFHATFEDNEPEYDGRKPFPDVLTYVDIQFGTQATALAVCDKVEGKIVFAATCADFTVRLVTLPLTPPGLEQQAAAKESAKERKKGRSARWNETIHTLGGFSTAPELVAITYQKSTETHAFPTLLVASYSHEVTGLLLLHTIPVSSEDGNPTYSVATSHSGPTQMQYLPSSASSLDFSPASSTLLVGFKSGCVRLYSAITSSWLLTLHTPFAVASLASSIHHISNATRKSVLDAKYVLDGKAIAVLLSDGEWGVWDVLGASPPGSNSKSILSQGGIKGGALTPFAIGGFIDGPPAKSSHHKPLTASTQSKFAPMTPATRRTVDVSAGLTSKSGNNGNSRQGRISVVSLHNSATQAHDDQIAFWIGDSYAIIHSLRGFWQGKTRHGGSLFGASGKCTTLERIEGVHLRGEKATGMGQFENEMCVLGEHRVVFVKSNKDVNRGKRMEFDEEEEQAEGGLEGLDRSLDLMEERRVASSGPNFRQSFGSSGCGQTSNGSGLGDSFHSFNSRA